MLLAACRFPGSVKPTVKIGLSAPFEGRYRDLGYEMLYSVRLAVRQRNSAGGVGDRFLVELVALNDFNEVDEAVVQAHKMAVDQQVLGVLGGWTPEIAESAAREYAALGLVVLVPEVDYSQIQPPQVVEAAFATEYESLSGGVPPGAAAVWAYSEANRLLDAIDTATRAEGSPSRGAVQQAVH